MGTALLVGNGFTANLIETYSNPSMLSRLEEKSPKLYQKANLLFERFRMPVSPVKSISVGWGYSGDGFSGAIPLFSGPISGLPYNSILITHIEKALVDTGFKDNFKQICEEYFQMYGLAYETKKEKISSIESLLKIISLFAKTGEFSEADKRDVISIASHLYFNDGLNRLYSVDAKFHNPIKLWLSQYDYIFTTNYDCLLDDACDDKSKVMHLHGGFYYKDRFSRVEYVLNPNDAYLVWGMDGDDKVSQLEGGMTFQMEFPLEMPTSLFRQYLNILGTENICSIDIFGYSGENDQHINHTISANDSIEIVNYYCDPKEIDSAVLRFELIEKFQINSQRQRLNLRSWDEIWSRLIEK